LGKRANCPAGEGLGLGIRDILVRRKYDSGDGATDIVSDFLEPVLSVATHYDRLAGYFNSGMLAAASRGMGSFIERGGVMRIVASPQLSAADIAALQDVSSLNDRMMVFERALSAAIEPRLIASSIEQDHVAAMAWMLKEGRLKVRIAVPKAGIDLDSLFHIKVGVASGDNREEGISFNGSINETSAAWTRNIENFKVFRSWVEAESDYFQDDRESFDAWWEPDDSMRATVVPLPDAVEARLLSFAPESYSRLDIGSNRRRNEFVTPKIVLRDYQIKAVNSWKDAGYRGILAMATGTGKTKTALGCFLELHGKQPKMVTIVTSPYQHISVQWSREFKEFAPLSLPEQTDWRRALRQRVEECLLGGRTQIVVSAVQDTAAHPDFWSILRPLKAAGYKYLFIGDEVHGLGARITRHALSENYDFRLGLSATPERYFDEVGTKFMEDYFGGDVYTFDIEEALAWRDPATGQRALCDYMYFPVLVNLEPDEEERYFELSDQLMVASSIDKEQKTVESEERVKKILRDRAMVLKKARKKLDALISVLPEISPIEQTLFYCVDTSQMSQVMAALNDVGVVYRRFSGAEGTTASSEFGGQSEREAILKSLGRGEISALVAMKCLDEGVDVPSAHTAVIMASSGNPREFVQRRGRILRPDGPSKMARIYDLVVVPNPRANRHNSADEAVKLFASEIKRMEEFGRSAHNSLEAQEKIVSIYQVMLPGGGDFE
jgi:superfamily II DNA or RNA helicase